MRWWVAGGFILFALFFVIANRGAYKGYFDGDDLANLDLTDTLGRDLYITKFFSPKLDQSNFRPVGHAFFGYFGRAAGLNYPRYILFIQVVHLINVFLAWMLLRALGFEPLNAAFGVLFFAFNMGTFEIYWKPMYVFDLFCATFTLASLLLWVYNRWILSWVAFWFAFRSKEVAIAIPVVLALIEHTRGTRRWKQLIPFFAVSLNFGIQAALGNRGRDNDYTLRFNLSALRTCIAYYGNRILVVPFGGVLIAGLLFVKDKRARLGVFALLLFMGPMLVLPGRLFGAYLYVPLIGVAIAAAAFSYKAGRIASLILVLIWLPLNYRQMQVRRKEQLAIADQNREYVGRVMQLVQYFPTTSAFIFDRSPEGLHYWGVRAAARYARRPHTDYQDAEIRTKQALALAGKRDLGYLMWIPGRDHLYMVHRTADTPDVPYIAMNEKTPLWQLGDGWRGLENQYQWTKLAADARVARPVGATQFELLVNVGPEIIDKLKKIKLDVILDDVKIGAPEFDTPGWRSLSFAVPPSSAPTTLVKFISTPGFFLEDHNPEEALGIAIGGFGFPTSQYPAVKIAIKH